MTVSRFDRFQTREMRERLQRAHSRFLHEAKFQKFVMSASHLIACADYDDEALDAALELARLRAARILHANEVTTSPAQELDEPDVDDAGWPI